MMVRLAQLARDYEHALDIKMSRQAKRMLRENVAAVDQLTTLSDSTAHLLRDSDRARANEAQLRVRLSVMESLEHHWAKKLRCNARVAKNARLYCHEFDKRQV